MNGEGVRVRERLPHGIPARTYERILYTLNWINEECSQWGFKSLQTAYVDDDGDNNNDDEVRY